MSAEGSERSTGADVDPHAAGRSSLHPKQDEFIEKLVERYSKQRLRLERGLPMRHRVYTHLQKYAKPDSHVAARWLAITLILAVIVACAL